MISEAEYEILVVKHGTAPTRRSDVYLNHKLYAEEDGPATTDYYLWVLRNETRTILVDTGFSPRAATQRGRQILVEPGEAYRQLGIDTEEPVTLVVTHCHYDHAGNLSLFPDAQVVLSAAEQDFWSSELSNRFLIGYYVESEDLAALRRAHEEGRVRTFSGTTEVAPGIELIEVGGHTPGQCMVKVSTRDGPVLLTSDAVHFRRELNEDMPFAAVTDLPALYQGLDHVRRMLESGEVVRVVTGHDPQELDDLPRVEGPLREYVGVIGGIPRGDTD